MGSAEREIDEERGSKTEDVAEMLSGPFHK
jgi:hypothetical protein